MNSQAERSAGMRLEYVFDYPSPYAYLASTRLKRLGIDADHMPIDIGTVMKAVNNQPSPACPPKARYAAMDAARWAALYGVPLEINWALLSAARDSSFEWHVLTRGALVARDLGLMEAYSTAVFGAIWAEPADLTSEQSRRAVLRKAGIDIPGLWERASTAKIGAQLDANNRQAIERGVFGVPTFLVDGELFFGNDRLDMALERLRG
jgi:2-hydroxychromene-2-carboxylate isomerase